jgi:hypothetical protein
MLALNLKELLRTEDMLQFLGTGHLHDPEAEGVTIRIPHNLRRLHSSEREEHLKELRIGEREGEPIDMDSWCHA